jgi:F5/8 type C domain/PEP-CTERM motif
MNFKTHASWVLALVFVFVVLQRGTAHAYSNLALSATATANSSYSPSYPSNAIDGDDSTMWNAGDWAYPSDPNWLEIDLGSIMNINQIFVFWMANDGQYGGYTNDYNFYTSTTGSDWTLQKSGTFIDETGNPDDYQFLLDFGSTGLAMRYAKYEVVRIVSDINNEHWSLVSEIELRGTDPANAVPEPATMLLLGCGLTMLVASRRKRDKI